MDRKMSRQAIIELGSNGIRYELFEFHSGGIRSIDKDLDRSDISSRASGDPADVRLLLRRLAADIIRLSDRSIRDGAGNCFVFGTEACRKMSEKVPNFWNSVNVDLKVLSPQEEGYYGLRAAGQSIERAGGDGSRIAAIDVGNGSTEVSYGSIDAGPEGIFCVSLAVGAAALERTLKKSKGNLDDLLAVLRKGNGLRQKPIDLSSYSVVVMGGLITKTAWIDCRPHEMARYNSQEISGHVLRRENLKAIRDDIYRVNKTLGWDSVKRFVDPHEREDWKAFQVIAGTMYFEGLMDVFNFDSFTVSGDSVRHGVVQEKYAAWKSENGL
jgi:exopolyphosphatase/pppGpp-phosphohydrolase